MRVFLEHAKELTDVQLSRRKFIGLGVLAAAGILPRAAIATVRNFPATERSLAFYHTHTGESLKATYYVRGEYVADALGDIYHILRDYRTDEMRDIDVRLLNLLHAIAGRLESREPFHIISGYRSPATNSLLHSLGNGVVLRSLHLEGKAVDIRLPDRDLSLVRREALAQQRGGVGYYPRSDFIHVDVGRVRAW